MLNSTSQVMTPTNGSVHNLFISTNPSGCAVTNPTTCINTNTIATVPDDALSSPGTPDTSSDDDDLKLPVFICKARTRKNFRKSS